MQTTDKYLFDRLFPTLRLILWNFVNPKYLTLEFAAVYKRSIILLSFLAYSLTLVHSVVPHHHHDEGKTDHHHHRHGNDKDHHHHGQDDGDKSLSHVFADAIHNPASEVVIHNPEPEHLQKSNYPVDLFISKIGAIIFLRIRPPDPLSDYQEAHYSTNHDSFYLLRAPPVASPLL